jgi:hypothetical protein
MVLPGEALRTHASDGLAHIFASLELPPPPGMHCLAAQLQAWLTASRDKTNESSRVAPETTLDPNLVDPDLIGLTSTVSRLLKAFFARYNALLKGTL